MKKILFLLLIAIMAVGSVVLMTPEDAYAKGRGTRSGGVSRDSIFDEISDWFVTLGKSDIEKQKIILERKANREILRQQKQYQRHIKRESKIIYTQEQRKMIAEQRGEYRRAERRGEF